MGINVDFFKTHGITIFLRYFVGIDSNNLNNEIGKYSNLYWTQPFSEY